MTLATLLFTKATWSKIVYITGRNAGITITHGAILRFFEPQRRHVPPIVAKFGTAEENDNPLRRTKFQVDRSICGDF